MELEDLVLETEKAHVRVFTDETMQTIAFEATVDEAWSRKGKVTMREGERFIELDMSEKQVALVQKAATISQEIPSDGLHHS
jgi:hypothetical protein